MINFWTKASLCFSHSYLTWAKWNHLLPICTLMMSIERLCDLPILRFNVRGLQSTTCFDHLLVCCRATCSAQIHLDLVIARATYSTPILLLMSSFLIRSKRDIPSISLTIDFWVVLSLFAELMVRDIVTKPFVITGSLHVFKTYSEGLIGTARFLSMVPSS